MEWFVAGAFAIVGGVLWFAWQRARAARTAADIAAAEAQRLAHQHQRAAEKIAAQLAATLEAQPEAVLVLAPDHTVVRLNPAARALFPQNAETTLMQLTRSVELDDLAAHALAGGEHCDRQLTLNEQPYRARAVRVGASPPAGVVLVLHDLSELQRLGRARRDFIANISHDLRTPLTSIQLLLEARDTAALEKIGAEVRALEHLAQELLDLAQIESGQAMVRLIPTSATDLLTTVVERLRPQAEHKRQTLGVEVSAPLLVLADAEQLQRALGNLIHNAIKFTPEGGRITVRVYPRADEAVIEVADTGPGIAPHDVPRVFERFFRGDRARTGGSGTGLGLAIAKHVVEAHGGRIEVESTGRPGAGALFRLTLLLA